MCRSAERYSLFVGVFGTFLVADSGAMTGSKGKEKVSNQDNTISWSAS